MNKSLIILAASLLACGVDAHEPTDSSDRLHQLLTEDRCSYCDDYRADQARQERQQRKIQKQLRRIETRQRWDRMMDFNHRALE